VHRLRFSVTRQSRNQKGSSAKSVGGRQKRHVADIARIREHLSPL